MIIIIIINFNSYKNLVWNSHKIDERICLN